MYICVGFQWSRFKTNKRESSFCVCFFSLQVEEQVKMLQKGVTHIGVGTPGRISSLIEKGRCQLGKSEVRTYQTYSWTEKHHIKNDERVHK